MARQFKSDKFGNKFTIVGCKENKNGFSVGYCELGGKLYKFEPSKSDKEGVSVWIRVTQLKKNNNSAY